MRSQSFCGGVENEMWTSLLFPKLRKQTKHFLKNQVHLRNQQFLKENDFETAAPIWIISELMTEMCFGGLFLYVVQKCQLYRILQPGQILGGKKETSKKRHFILVPVSFI